MPIIHGYPKIIISNLLTCYVSAKQTHNSRPDRGTLFADVAQVLVAKGHGEDALETWRSVEACHNVCDMCHLTCVT